MKTLVHLLLYLGIIGLFVAVVGLLDRFVVDLALVPPSVSLSAGWWRISLQIVAWICMIAFCLIQVTALFYFFSEGTDSSGDVVNVSLIGTVVPYVVVVVVSTVSVIGLAGSTGSFANAEGDVSASADLQPATKSAQKKLEGIREQLQEDVRPALEKLAADAGGLKADLRALGVNSSADLEGNYRAQTLARELAEVLGYLELLKKKKAVYEKAEFDLETMLRRLERRRLVEDAGLSADEISEVKLTLKRIDSRLADLAEAPPELGSTRLDALIDAELAQ